MSVSSNRTLTPLPLKSSHFYSFVGINNILEISSMGVNTVQQYFKCVELTEMAITQTKPIFFIIAKTICVHGHISLFLGRWVIAKQ